MRRKWMAALCVASLSMAMMTGCGNGSTQETAKETQTEKFGICQINALTCESIVLYYYKVA